MANESLTSKSKHITSDIIAFIPYEGGDPIAVVKVTFSLNLYRDFYAFSLTR